MLTVLFLGTPSKQTKMIQKLSKAYLVRCRLYGKLHLSYPSTKNLKNSDLRNHITAAGTAIWVNGGGNDELEEPQAVSFFLVGLFSEFFFKNSRLET